MGSSLRFGSIIWGFPGLFTLRFHSRLSNFFPTLITRWPIIPKVHSCFLCFFCLHSYCFSIVQFPTFPHGTFRYQSHFLSFLSRRFYFLPAAFPLLPYSPLFFTLFSLTTTSRLSFDSFSEVLRCFNSLLLSIFLYAFPFWFLCTSFAFSFSVLSLSITFSFFP